ncbi:MAG: helix-turn-helix transcriptional regulator [Clostridia bacterium]|nr:helix-turn-helix transcriptional regulator [Clostridia bacterium]
MSEEFAKFVVTNEIKFKYAKGMRDITGKEIHIYHEIFFFIGGDAEFISEQGSTKLSPFTTIIVPKNTFHCFIVHGEEKDYCRCVLNFENVSNVEEIINEKLKNIFITKDKTIELLFLQMREIHSLPLSQTEKEILLKSYFSQLIVFLKGQEEPAFEIPVNPVTEKAITYINQNIGKQLTVQQIAKAQHISESYLAHIFKKDMHIPIYKYILEKRIFLADKKIKCNIPATQAAIECGFQDYSGFYKHYKKIFGMPPTGMRH